MMHSIQAVVQETGITAHVLRVWEKRYRAVVPKRTKTQRRVYSEADIRRLKMLRQATSLGHPISSVAKLSDEKLKKLVRGKSALASSSRAGNGPATDTKIIRDCVAAVKAFDGEALNILLSRAVVDSGYNALLRHVVAPLTQRLGQLWSEGTLQIAHEHFATAAIRAFLLNPARQYAGASSTSTLISATPQGQLHELGAVMAASLAAEQGWHSIYLGPSLPAGEIAGAAVQNKARVVVLSIIYPEDDQNVDSELRDLRRFLPTNVAVFVSGRAADRYDAAIAATGAVLIKDLAHLQIELAKIRAGRT